MRVRPRRPRRQIIATVAATVVAAALAPAMAGAQAPAPPDLPVPLPTLPSVPDVQKLVMDYRVHAVYKAPDGSLVTTDQDAKATVPALVDVDHDVTTGVAGNDISVRLTLDASGQPALEVLALPNAPSPMPLSVKAIVTLDQGGTKSVAVGYDALADTAPGSWTATLASGGASGFAVDLTTSNPGKTLGVVGEQVLLDGTRKDARIDFTPVPATAHIGGQRTSGTTSDRWSLNLKADTPTKGTLTVRDIRANGETRLDGVIDAIPADLSVVLTSYPSGRQTVSYKALDSAGNGVGLAALTLKAKELDQAGAVRSSHDVGLRGLPGQLDIDAVPAAAQPGGGQSSRGTVAYTASGPLTELTADIVDPSGVFGRAKELHLRLGTVPAGLDLTYGESGSTLSLDAAGKTLGLIEAQLTSGPNDRLAPTTDGVLYRDLADRYVVFARITGLRKVVASPQGPDVQLDTTGGRLLTVDLDQRGTFVRGTLDSLPASVGLQVRQTSTTQTINYTASAPARSLVVDTNAGGGNMHASVGGPLPASIAICKASGGQCSNMTGANVFGSVKVTASEHTTVNVQTPSLTVTNLRIRHLQVDANQTPFEGCFIWCWSYPFANGDVYLDTTPPGCTGGACGALTGDITTQGASVHLPAGFWAHDRFRWWGYFGAVRGSHASSGPISCPPGTFIGHQIITDVICSV